MENLIKAMFKDLIENTNYDETVIHKYFSPEYVQIVDNQILNFESFKKHIQRLKEKLRESNVQFVNIVSNETSTLTKHIVKSILKDGTVVKHKVFAEFIIENGKLIECDELTMLIEGDKLEQDLGSAV